MNIDDQQLIQSYLDDALTAEQHDQLSQWLKADPAHAREFASAAMLHDRLRNEAVNLEPSAEVVPLPAPAATRRWSGSFFALTTACLLLVAAFFIWQSAGTNSAAAAVVELNRIIAASSQPRDRTFSISVEETALPPRPRAKEPAERGRPPKPSIDGATLHVRGPNQFVLQRRVNEQQLFITGSNGKTSWAVRPDGPVRVSPDLSRFNHDVPGHEHAMPLNNLHDGLEQLRKAYDVEVLPIEDAEEDAGPNADPSRLLVAVKKRGFRGPLRMEITYAAVSGQIRQVRFVEMPYGPERLTLRMTLVAERDQSADFFDHQSHHDPQRAVEIEE